MSDIDPTGTPLPRPASGAGLDAHECLHPELIDDVRQQRRRRWPVILAVLALAGGSVGAISTCLYTQGEAQGQTIQRIEAVEDRAREDRVEADRQRERQRQDVTDAVQRHEELIQELHRLDSRLGRIEERLPPRR
jgi:cytochrome c-type biogenesis protein CcmH/NrfG